MSKIKNPREKKRKSLAEDRRNSYGENAKASRKKIPKGKQLRHMDERRRVAHVLRNVKGAIAVDDVAAAAESKVKTATANSRSRGFKKHPDAPLGAVLARKGKR